jgi:hypothetical protein
MAGGLMSTGYGALDFLMAGGGGSSFFGGNPYSPTTTGIGGMPFGFGGGNTTNTNNSYGNSYADPYSAYGYGGGSSVSTGTQAGSGYLSSDQGHQSTQSASAAFDGRTENNLFMNQKDLQKVNVFLDPQIGAGRSGTNMPIAGFLTDLVDISTAGSAATTDVNNKQQIGLDQSAYAEEGGTAINNSYQVQNNTQIVNIYLDLNLQMPGMPMNPWMPSPWMPGSHSPYPTNYSSAFGQPTGPVGGYGQPSGYGNVGGYGNTGGHGNVGGGYPTPAPQPAPTPQYDPTHVAPYQDFVLTTTDLEYSDRSALRETIKEYARFFDDNGARPLGRAFMTLAGAVGSGENIERAERRFLRFEDAVSDLTAEEKAYFHEGLVALASEIPSLIADPAAADELDFILNDLGEVVSGYSYTDLGYGDSNDDNVDVAA